MRVMAHHAHFGGELKFHGAGWAHDWITNWTRTEDSILWNVDVVHGGRYEVSLSCRCPKSDAGSRVRIAVAESSVEGEIQAAEPGEGQWEVRRFGEFELKPGKAELTMKALSKPGKTVMEINMLLLKRLD